MCFFMDDKELKKEVSGADAPESSENSSEKETLNAPKTDDWEFDAKAPTLENEIELDDEFEIDISEDVKEEKNNNDAEKMPKEKKKFKIKNKKAFKIAMISIACAIVVAIITAVCVWFFTVPNSDEKMNLGNVALTVGNTDVSIGMYNYYYQGTVNSYLQQAQYGYNDIDPTVPYDEQFTTDEDGNKISWLDVFKKDTIDHIQYVLSYYEAALENGITMTEAQKNQIDEYIKGVASSAANKEMSIDAYIQQEYGEHCGEATLRKILKQSSIASNYYQQVLADNKTDENAFNAYFEENKKQYLSAKFSCIEILGEGTDEASLAKLEKRVEEYQSKVKDKASLISLIPTASAELIDQYIEHEYFKTEKEAVDKLSEASEMTLNYGEIKNEFSAEIADWLVDGENGVGKTNYYIDKDYGFAYLFVKTEKPFYPKDELYSVRHILVIPESANQSEESNSKVEYTEAEWKAALEKANSILKEYNEGDKTEVSFALLAEAKSDDTESTSSGSSGFYGGAFEGVPLGQMVPEFEKWAVDKTRKYGDVEIVKSQFGYHIMYFIYDGPQYLFNANADFKVEKITNYEKGLAEKYTVKERQGISRTKIAEPIESETK